MHVGCGRAGPMAMPKATPRPARRRLGARPCIGFRVTDGTGVASPRGLRLPQCLVVRRNAHAAPLHRPGAMPLKTGIYNRCDAPRFAYMHLDLHPFPGRYLCQWRRVALGRRATRVWLCTGLASPVQVARRRSCRSASWRASEMRVHVAWRMQWRSRPGPRRQRERCSYAPAPGGWRSAPRGKSPPAPEPNTHSARGALAQPRPSALRMWT